MNLNSDDDLRERFDSMIKDLNRIDDLAAVVRRVTVEAEIATARLLSQHRLPYVSADSVRVERVERNEDGKFLVTWSADYDVLP